LRGVSAFGVTRPYLFEVNTRSVTMDSLPCFTIPGTLLSLELRKVMPDVFMCFQQDGIRAHTTRRAWWRWRREREKKRNKKKGKGRTGRKNEEDKQRMMKK